MWRRRGKWAKPMGLGYPRANASPRPPRRARAQQEIAPAGRLHADSGGTRLLPSPPHFSQKMLVSVPSTWAARDHLTVPPLSITATGAVSAAGGRGRPLLPLHRRRGSGPPALGPLLCHSDVSTALFEQQVVFLACKATAAGGTGQAAGLPGPQSGAERGPGRAAGSGRIQPSSPPEPGTWLLGLRIPRGGRSWKSRSSAFRLPAALQRALKVLQRRAREGAGDEPRLRGAAASSPEPWRRAGGKQPALSARSS